MTHWTNLNANMLSFYHQSITEGSYDCDDEKTLPLSERLCVHLLKGDGAASFWMVNGDGCMSLEIFDIKNVTMIQKMMTSQFQGCWILQGSTNNTSVDFCDLKINSNYLKSGIGPCIRSKWLEKEEMRRVRLSSWRVQQTDDAKMAWQHSCISCHGAEPIRCAKRRSAAESTEVVVTVPYAVYQHNRFMGGVSQTWWTNLCPTTVAQWQEVVTSVTKLYLFLLSSSMIINHGASSSGQNHPG